MTPTAIGQLLPLFLAVPIVLGALSTVLRSLAARRLLLVGTPLLSFLGAAGLLVAHQEHGTIAHAIGNYADGIAIPFASDSFSALIILTASGVVFCASWFAIAAGEDEARFFPALALMLLGGVNAALLTADLFNFFVAMEVMLLPSYGLIAMSGTWSRLSGSRVFVIVNLFASTTLLAGVVLVYATAGTVNMAALAHAARGNGPVTVAMGIVMLALAVKAGMVPLHTWLPRTYAGTSATVMTLFSAIHTKVAFVLMFRLSVLIFGLDPRWTWLVIVLMSISIIVGSIGGMAGRTIREVLAYQMVTGMPHILIVLAFATSGGDFARAALAAGVLYAVHHMVTMGSLLLTSGAIEETYGSGNLHSVSGIMHRDPWVAAVFAAGAFSLVGLPPMSGLWGKVGIMIAAAEPADMRSWVVLTVIVIGSFFSLLAMIRVWREVFWGRPMQKVNPGLRIHPALSAPGALLVLVSFGMFLLAGPVSDAAAGAAEALINVDGYVAAVFDNPDAAIAVPEPQPETGGAR